MVKKLLTVLCLLTLLLGITVLSANAEKTESVLCNIDFNSLNVIKTYVTKGADACFASGQGIDGTGALVLNGKAGTHTMIEFKGVSVLPDVEYNVTYYVKMPKDATLVAPNAGGSKVFFRFDTIDATRTGVANDKSGDWVKVSATVVSEVGADEIQFCMLNCVEGVNVYIDNFTLSTSDPRHTVDREFYNRSYTLKKEIENDAFNFDSLEAVRKWSSTNDRSYSPNEGIDGSGALKIIASGSTQAFRITGLDIETGLWCLGFSYKVASNVNIVKVNNDGGAKLYISAADDGYNRVGMPSTHDGEWQTVSMAVPVLACGTVQITLQNIPEGTEILIDNVKVGLIDYEAERVDDAFDSVAIKEYLKDIDFSTDSVESDTGSDTAEVSDTGAPAEKNNAGITVGIVGAVVAVGAAALIINVRGKKNGKK